MVHFLDYITFKNVNVSGLPDPDIDTTFRRGITGRAATLLSDTSLGAHAEVVGYLLERFQKSCDYWVKRIRQENIIENAAAKHHLLHIGIWDSAYLHDANGSKSPYGPWLAVLGALLKKVLGSGSVGLLISLSQQLADENHVLREAQALLDEMHAHYHAFLSSNGISAIVPGKQYPPFVQLHPGKRAVNVLAGAPLPSIIVINKAKGSSFTGFSPIPHEFGHEVSGTFKDAELVKEIRRRIIKTDIEMKAIWTNWAEESLADAINVAMLEEKGICGLAALFANEQTNKIYKNPITNTWDEHPCRHIRILLAIEVGKLLGLDETVLMEIETEWRNHSEKHNGQYGANMIYDAFKNKTYDMHVFEEAIRPVADILVDSGYSQLNGCKVGDMFRRFNSARLDRLRDSISRSWWKPE